VSRQPVVIYSAANTQQAHLLKGLLCQSGISAWVVNDATQMAGGELPLGWTAAPRVVVSDDDALEARQFAEEFDRKTAQYSIKTADDEPALTHWTDWPICPTCGARQSARCSICAASGTDFMLADVEVTPAGEEVLLKCNTCDDVFSPQWYRLCPQCGHDYGQGIDVAESGLSKIEIDPATLWVSAGLLTGVGTLIAYFFWLFA
jgi:predicted RNA-binding Zn-ribbon protein involved in translation (DUF1610 family)